MPDAHIEPATRVDVASSPPVAEPLDQASFAMPKVVPSVLIRGAGLQPFILVKINDQVILRAGGTFHAEILSSVNSEFGRDVSHNLVGRGWLTTRRNGVEVNPNGNREGHSSEQFTISKARSLLAENGFTRSRGKRLGARFTSSDY